MSEHCDFCGIAESEPNRIILHNESVTSFLSRPTLAGSRVHALIVPNRHVVLPHEMTDEEVLATLREADRLGQIMLETAALAVRGVDRWQKTRPDVAEGAIKRNHIHTHVLGSGPGSSLYDKAIHWGGDQAVWTMLQPDDYASLTSLLRPTSVD
jgi:diadenosine tetraphosphate (Ap4A) HIT family hydrolase